MAMSGMVPYILFTTPKPRILGTPHVDAENKAKVKIADGHPKVSRQTNPLDILKMIGISFEVTFSDGTKTRAVVLTYPGVVRNLGIDLNTVFKGCGGREEFNEKTDVIYRDDFYIRHDHNSPQNGALVNLDLYQQVALLKAIVKVKPELKDVLGFYNLRGLREIDYLAWYREQLNSRFGIFGMWPLERYIPDQEERQYIAIKKYPEAGIVTLDSIGQLGNGRFVGFTFPNGFWEGSDPGFRDPGYAVVLGAKKI